MIQFKTITRLIQENTAQVVSTVVSAAIASAYAAILF